MVSSALLLSSVLLLSACGHSSNPKGETEKSHVQSEVDPIQTESVTAGSEVKSALRERGVVVHDADSFMKVIGQKSISIRWFEGPNEASHKVGALNNVSALALKRSNGLDVNLVMIPGLIAKGDTLAAVAEAHRVAAREFGIELVVAVDQESFQDLLNQESAKETIEEFVHGATVVVMPKKIPYEVVRGSFDATHLEPSVALLSNFLGMPTLKVLDLVSLPGSYPAFRRFNAAFLLTSMFQLNHGDQNFTATIYLGTGNSTPGFSYEAAAQAVPFGAFLGHANVKYLSAQDGSLINEVKVRGSDPSVNRDFGHQFSELLRLSSSLGHHELDGKIRGAQKFLRYEFDAYMEAARGGLAEIATGDSSWRTPEELVPLTLEEMQLAVREPEVRTTHALAPLFLKFGEISRNKASSMKRGFR